MNPKSDRARRPASTTISAATAAKAPVVEATIEGACRALGQGAYGEAMRHLLAVWAVTPDPEVAAAIEQVGALAATGTQVPGGKTAGERSRAWVAAAATGDPVGRLRLLETLGEKAKSAELVERLDALAPWPDPRFEQVVLTLVEEPPVNASVSRTQPFWKVAFSLLEASRSPAIARRAGELPAIWAQSAEVTELEREALRRKHAKIAATLEKTAQQAPTLAAGDRAALAEGLARIAGALTSEANAGATEAALLAAVYAAPADDAPRLVYADWLQERGDPRGELITLQILGARTPAQRAREKALLAEHAVRWLGAIGTSVTKSSMRWERGFLAACRLVQTQHRAVPDPAWATVVELDGGLPISEVHPMPALRRAVNVGIDELTRLGALSILPPLECLGWASGFDAWSPRERWAPRMQPAFDGFERAALSHLRRLELLGAPSWAETSMPPTAIGFAWKTKPALRELAVVADPRRLADWILDVMATGLTHLELARGDRIVAERTWDATSFVIATRGGAGVPFDRVRFVTSKHAATDEVPDAVTELLATFGALTAAQRAAITTLELVLPSERWVLPPDQARIADLLAGMPQATATIAHHAK